MNIAQKIAKLIESDVDYKQYYDSNVTKKYASLTESEKRKLDDIFAYICGYELGTVIAMKDSALLIDLGL